MLLRETTKKRKLLRPLEVRKLLNDKPDEIISRKQELIPIFIPLKCSCGEMLITFYEVSVIQEVQ